MKSKKSKPKRKMAAASLANLSPWQPGQSGSTQARSPGPKDTRRGRLDLASDLADSLARDFEKHGAEAIRKLRKASPASYIRACITMVPKESLVIVSPYEGMTDQDIRDRLAALMRQTQPKTIDIDLDIPED